MARLWRCDGIGCIQEQTNLNLRGSDSIDIDHDLLFPENTLDIPQTIKTALIADLMIRS
jgi:hypothetical protein